MTNLNPVVGIDVGTTEIAAVIVRADNENIELLGMAVIPFDNSISDNRVKIEYAMKAAVRNACENIVCQPELAIVGIRGFASSWNARAIVGIEDKVTWYDIQRVKDLAIGKNNPEDMALLEQVANSYYLDFDDDNKIVNPHKMAAYRLEIDAHNIFANKAMMKDVVSAINKIDGLVSYITTSAELAAASMLLNHEEMQHGICLVDISVDDTSIVVFHNGMLKHTATLPWGSDRLIAQIRLQIGSNEIITEQANIDGLVGNAREMNETIHKLVNMEQLALCSLLDAELCKSNLKGLLAAGIVLTGGTSVLSGLQEIIGCELMLSVRMAQFQNRACFKDIPLRYAGAAGLAFYGFKLPESNISPCWLIIG